MESKNDSTQESSSGGTTKRIQPPPSLDLTNIERVHSEMSGKELVEMVWKSPIELIVPQENGCDLKLYGSNILSSFSLESLSLDQRLLNFYDDIDPSIKDSLATYSFCLVGEEVVGDVIEEEEELKELERKRVVITLSSISTSRPLEDDEISQVCCCF